MMRIEAVKEKRTDGVEELKEIFLNFSLSFEELIAMDKRGEFFDRYRGNLPFYADSMEIRRNGEVVEQSEFSSLRDMVRHFAESVDVHDLKEYEAVFRVKTSHADTDSFEETENSDLYRQLRHKILVDGEKHLKICGNDKNIRDIKKTVLRLSAELGNLGFACGQPGCREIIALHPGYDYEDFMEKVVSLRATEDTRKGLRDTTDIVRIDGVFKEFCNTAARYNVLVPHVLVIENYGIVMPERLFGEALNSMSPEHRDDNIKIRTMYQSYPSIDSKDHFADGFYIPDNVVVIGIWNGQSGSESPVISPIYF